MEPSKIPPGTLSLSATVGTLLAAILGKFDGHPGWLCCALGIVALVAISRGITEAWKARKLPQVPPAAVVLALLLVPSLALASEGVKTGGVSFAHAFVLLLGVLVVLGVSGLAIVRRARCLTWPACALVLVVSGVARADDPPPAAARAQAPALLPAAPAPEVPSVTQEAAANAVPPVACPEPCEACGRKLGGTAAAVGLPTWSKWLVGIGAGLTFAATVAERGHAVGLW